MNDFDVLLKVIQRYQVEQPIHDEKDLEVNLTKYLIEKNYHVKRQLVKGNMRNDLVVYVNEKKICLELKVKAGAGIDKQIDKYIPHYKDGIIIVCWNASGNLKTMLEFVKSLIKQRIEIVELRKGQSLV